MMDLADWIERHDQPGVSWYIKRLSGNDTGANKSHQAGPYIPKEFLFSVFAELNDIAEKNPRIPVISTTDSHGGSAALKAIYYNSRHQMGQRNGRRETRLTGFGGRESALLDPESTGSIAAFAFPPASPDGKRTCHIWVCRNPAEENLIEDWFGVVEPQRAIIVNAGQNRPAPKMRPRLSCWLAPPDLPAAWLDVFPSGAEIIRKATELRDSKGLRPDKRLLKRRECEYEIFRSLEEAVEFPVIKAGFPTFEAFLERANSIMQRRKARAGKSLELHARQIFVEERLEEGTHFAFQPESEPGNRPDFLFPSEAAYRDPAFPAGRLRMLAAKTTCKDRWRQIIKEANRIPEKHLLTLQEGISESQFCEMTQAGVRLVVPEELATTYPPSIRPHLLTLEAFIGEVRNLGPA